MNAVGVTWSDREPPLLPCAVVAQGDVATQLARRLLDFDGAALARLSGVSGKNILVLLGEETNLPWVDGVFYLGRDPQAPMLLLPTRIEPRIPGAHLLERAMRKHFPKIAPPLAILPDTFTVVSCAQALQLSRSHIERWLAEGTT